jgi:hypothetical protein
MPDATSVPTTLLGRTIRNIVWLFLLVDFVALLYFGIQEPEIFKAIVDQTQLLIGAVLWGLAFFGLVVGGILRNGFGDFDQFLGDTKVQIAVVFLTAVLLYGLIWNPPQVSATMVLRVVPDVADASSDPPKGTIRLEVYGGGDTTRYEETILAQDSVKFTKIALNRDYKAMFEPAKKEEFFGAVESWGRTQRGTIQLRLGVRRILRGVVAIYVDIGDHQKQGVPGQVRIIESGSEIARGTTGEFMRIRAGEYVAVGDAQKAGTTKLYRYHGEQKFILDGQSHDTLKVVVQAHVIQ